MKQTQDIVGEKFVKDDANKLAYSDRAKKNALKQHYQCLLNVELKKKANFMAPIYGWGSTASRLEPLQ